MSFVSLLTLLAPVAAFGSTQEHSLQSPARSMTLAIPLSQSDPWSNGGSQSVRVNLVSGDVGLSEDSIKRVSSIIRTESWPVIKSVFQGIAPSDIRLVLYNTPLGYQDAVAQEFSGNAADIAARTGGFTVGTTVYVPIYKYVNQNGALANTIAHEFTHVFLNTSGVSKILPEWLNEGFAWTVGLTAEARVHGSGVGVLLGELSIQLDNARKNKTLAPLTTGTNVGLQKNFTYNLEYEDYLAVKNLESRYGPNIMEVFLKNALSHGVEQSFDTTFNMTMQEYESSFYSQLSKS